jgi:hypothetical protein
MHPVRLTPRRSRWYIKAQSTLVAPFILAVTILLLGPTAVAQTPAVGVKAPDFTLSTITGTPVRLTKQQHGNPLVLVVLRGYPGYQCPFCQKQVHDFVEHAADFAAKKATVYWSILDRPQISISAPKSSSPSKQICPRTSFS